MKRSIGIAILTTCTVWLPTPPDALGQSTGAKIKTAEELDKTSYDDVGTP